MEPIIEPELTFSENQFLITTDQWGNLLDDLEEQGISNISPTSKQYLEDCKANETHLIAITGYFDFNDITFPFTAQFSFDGYIIYINEPKNDTSFLKKLLTKSKDHEVSYTRLISSLSKIYQWQKNA